MRKSYPLLDLRDKIGMERKGHDKNILIIVFEVEGKYADFIVDAVKEVLRIPKRITRVNSEFIIAIAKFDDRLITLSGLKKIVHENQL